MPLSVVGPRRCADHADRGDGRRLPIVATDCGSVRDMVEDGEQGFVVPVGDVEHFADRLAHDELLRIRLGKSGRARVESEFQIQNTARGYEELLTDMLARKS